MSNLSYLLQRSFVGSCLDIVKMKPFVPCDVQDEVTKYKGKIVDIVFDPLKTEEVNARFEAAGYHIPEDMLVIAITAEKKILVWGGLNSVYYLKKGERLHKSLEENLAFYDIVELTCKFKTRNKKVEIDELHEKLKKKAKKKK